VIDLERNKSKLNIIEREFKEAEKVRRAGRQPARQPISLISSLARFS